MSNRPVKNIRCQLDGRLFLTKGALKQHRAACHAGTSGLTNQKPQYSSPKSHLPGLKMSSQDATFSGSDIIGSVTLTDTDKAGTLLLMWDVNPLTLIDTRVHQFGSVFTRWRPRKLDLQCIPGAGVFTPGSYAIGWVADPEFDIGLDRSRVTRVTSLSPSILSAFGSPKTLRIPCDTTQKWYLCRPGIGVESDHGRVVAVLAAMVGGKNITINFRLDWTLEFSSPELPSTVEEQECYPDPQWIPIFTDSVSDWGSGNKLTFKHSEGGAVVPFIGIRDNVVYKPSKGVVVPYVKSDGTTANCSWFARMRDSAVYSTAMVCFASEADAKAYVGSGDIGKVLTYKAAGDYVTPNFPTFIGTEVARDAPRLELTHTVHRLRLGGGESTSPPALNVAWASSTKKK